MTTYFHTTDAAAAILRDGFRGGGGGYMLIGLDLCGVFLADEPVGPNEGAKGDDVLAVVLPDGMALDDYEIVEDLKGYREWCIPADVINRLGRVRQLTEEEALEASSARW
ncbi:hypothetical protein ACIQWZ_19930 [Streptomyces sp. NPDC098077]|uniref:hypothetical protein n=1 Tax=Streptomyces sp. NPDC098077 TaxID=3366093 RepID=UPI003808AB6D